MSCLSNNYWQNTLLYFAFYIVQITFILVFFSCENEDEYRFRYVFSEYSGVHFSNDIIENDSINILDFHYLYNGGGVGIADLNNDGLSDLVFSGNQVSSRLYLNRGQLKFEDISEVANFQTNKWVTGVSIVDINADSQPDIYLSVGGKTCNGKCENELYIHQGLDENDIPQFKEMADEYGLTDGLYTQQAAFFDYDLDGDLDVYLLHNVVDPNDKNSPSPKRYINAQTTDQLLRNDTKNNIAHPIFTDVSEEMGITNRGYGLGIAIEDFNQDGYADVYVANDFLSEDLLYLNNGVQNAVHQGFTESSKSVLAHQTYNSMGVDVADVNSDGLPEIVVVDMLPAYHERQKTMIGFMNYDKFQLSQKQGYTPQFMRNTLQVNNGFLDREMLQFSELGYMADIYKTDWSWTPLLADFDNDGDRDLYITNGYVKDITDLDFVNYSKQGNVFGTPEARRKGLENALADMEGIKLNNFFYENITNNSAGAIPQFKDRSSEWIRPQKSYSNGAAYADLDNDGDLDIVVNNINDKAFILENTSNLNTNNYLQIQLKSTSQNSNKIGTKIYLFDKEKIQYHFQSPQRGYLSTVSDVIHFGLGKSTEIDSVKIIWQDRSVQSLYEVNANQLLEVKHESPPPSPLQRGRLSDSGVFSRSENLPLWKGLGGGKTPIFTNPNDFFQYQHKENAFHDYYVQHLLLRQYSRSGPCFAIGNINENPENEIFIGGAKGTDGHFFSPIGRDAINRVSTNGESTDALLFDADNDGDNDLYIVMGGSESKAESEAYQDELWLNDGIGNFTKTSENLPKTTASGACAVGADFDQDGDTDLFVGGRMSPQKYPNIPRSYLLENQGGKFVDITSKDLSQIGMVTDAISEDFDGDGWMDLIIVGEWMSPVFFHNKKGKLSRSENHFYTKNKGKTAIRGLWNCLAAADVDNDGDMDFLAGNQGLNTNLSASLDEPLILYTNDYDNNGSPDPIVARYFPNKSGKRKLYPIHARDDVMKQLVKLKADYQTYTDFSKIDFETLLKPKNDQILTVNQLQSCYFENDGTGNFMLYKLPLECQVAPVKSMLADDFDGDGKVDVLVAGNDYSAESNGGWHDAMTGVFLRGKGDGTFDAMSSSESGFYVPGDARDMAIITKNNGQKMILVGQNSDSLKIFLIRP